MTIMCLVSVHIHNAFSVDVVKIEQQSASTMHNIVLLYHSLVYHDVTEYF